MHAPRIKSNTPHDSVKTFAIIRHRNKVQPVPESVESAFFYFILLQDGT